MKYIVLMTVAGIAFFTACNSSSNQSKTGNDTTQSISAANDSAPRVVSNQTSPTPVKEIVSGYLKMKDALASDDDKGAGTAGDEMVAAFQKFDKSSLTAEQKKTYEDVESDAKEHAEHIGKSVGNIKHQREHFDMLSKDMYDLVKTFGGGQKLYYDHCPMYNNNKGADWISETKEIANPYLGKEMSTCGSIKEELK